MKPIRLIVIAAMSVVAIAAVQQTALAAAVAGSCTVSSTTLKQGESFTVSGRTTVPETVQVILDGSVLIGTGFSSGSPPVFSITATIPSTTSAPATHTVSVQASSGPPVGCASVFVTSGAAATPTPTPVPTAAPTPTPTVVFVPVTTATTPPGALVAGGFPLVVQQQQQQQQQQGGGGGSPQRQGDPARSAGGGQQQQQQQQASGPVLPRTGADILRTAAWGSGLLAFGLLLVLWARRRRRLARARALADMPSIDAVVVEPEFPWLPGSPHPSEFLTEADGLPPAFPVSDQLYLPAPEEATADEDFLIPSF